MRTIKTGGLLQDAVRELPTDDDLVHRLVRAFWRLDHRNGSVPRRNTKPRSQPAVKADLNALGHVFGPGCARMILDLHAEVDAGGKAAIRMTPSLQRSRRAPAEE